MRTIPLSRTAFDAMRPRLETMAREWATRECASFDKAVQGTAGAAAGEGSIWEMPSIDSKRAVALLVELEPVVGCKLPCSLVQQGGYATIDELVASLLTRIRQCCVESPPSVGAATAPIAAVTGVAAALLTPLSSL
jgi:hypothetical protein